MSTIYELKTQIFDKITTEIQSIFYNNLDLLKSDNITNKNIVNAELKKNIDNYISIDIIISTINLQCKSNKDCFYNIAFSLLININAQFYFNNEYTVYSIIEKTVKLLHLMDFYYCYKLHNSNININMPRINEDNLIKKCILVSWYTNISINTCWLD